MIWTARARACGAAAHARASRMALCTPPVCAALRAPLPLLLLLLLLLLLPPPPR